MPNRNAGEQPDQATPYLSEGFIKSMHAKLVTIEGDLTACTLACERNAQAVERVESNTQNIVDTFQALAGGFKVLQGLGRLAKPLAYIVGLVTAVITAYSAWRGIR